MFDLSSCITRAVHPRGCPRPTRFTAERRQGPPGTRCDACAAPGSPIRGCSSCQIGSFDPAAWVVVDVCFIVLRLLLLALPESTLYQMVYPPPPVRQVKDPKTTEQGGTGSEGLDSAEPTDPAVFSGKND